MNSTKNEHTQLIEDWLERLLDATPSERESLLKEAERVPGLRGELESALARDDDGGTTRLLDPRAEADPLADIPAAIGPFRIIKKLGEGGMSTVYLGEHKEKGWYKLVAVKVMSRTGAHLAERLREERELLGHLEHPGIAQIRDGGETEDGRPYLVMEYVDGTTLDGWCDGHSLSVKERLGLFLDVCDAVEAAHQSLIVHRDIKPSNVLVRKDGQVKLVDFGIATSLRTEPAADGAGRKENRMVSAQYSSPEQVRGERVDTRSDVYSLGVLLYRLLTGRHPYPEDPRGWLHAVEEGRASSLEDGLNKNPELSWRLDDELEWVVARCLRYAPEGRYPNVGSLAKDLRSYLDGYPVVAAPVSRIYPVRKWVARHRLAVGSALAVFLSAVLAAGVFYTQKNKAEEADARKELIVQSYRDLFRLSEAGGDIPVERFVEHGVGVMERMQGDRQAQAQLAATLGVIHRELASFEDAENLFRDALPDLSRERAIEAKTELAWTLFRLDRHDEASKLLEDALETCELEASPCAATLNVLGMVRLELDELDVADKLLDRAVATAVLEENPYEEAEGITNLSVLRGEMGEMEEAIELAGRALELRRRLFGETHLLTAEAENNLGNAVGQNGDLERAEDLLRRAHTTRRDFLGEDHPNTLQSLNGLAQSVRYQPGRLEDSIPFFRRAADGYGRVFGASHTRTLSTQQNMALVLLELEQLDDAKDLLAGILNIRRTGSPPGDLGKTLIAWGDLQLRLGLDVPAEEALREASELLADSLGEKSRHTWRARVLHSLATTRTDGRTAACSAYNGMAEVIGADHPTAVSLSQRLAAQQINCTTEGS